MMMNNWFYSIGKRILLTLFCFLLLGCKEKNNHKYGDIFGAYHAAIAFFDYDEACY